MPATATLATARHAGGSAGRTASRVERGWLPRWRRRHTAAAAVATLVTTAVIGMTEVPSLGAQLVLLAVLVALTGLPHGAADHLAGRALLAHQFGRLWIPFFGALYVGIAAFVLVAWLAFPPAALTAFLLLAVLHFGFEDAQPIAYDLGGRGIGAFFQGLIPVAGPVLFHVEDTAVLFGWLLPGTSIDAVGSALATLALGLPALVGAWIGLAAVHALRGTPTHRRMALEILTLVVLVAVAPPLLAFGIYFCGWHSVRHVLGEAHRLDRKNPWRGIGRFVREAAPVTLASILLGGLAYAVLAAGAKPDVALTRVLFIGLASIAVPHIAIRAAYERTRDHGGLPAPQ